MLWEKEGWDLDLVNPIEIINVFLSKSVLHAIELKLFNLHEILDIGYIKIYQPHKGRKWTFNLESLQGICILAIGFLDYFLMVNDTHDNKFL